MEDTAGINVPSIVTRKVLSFFNDRHWVASTCSISEVPIPNASAAKAPWVVVCESPQTMVMPGKVTPCSGPMTCRMP
ncbi:hypothetical protein D3C78_1617940 [compost metagenome]